MTKKFAVNDQFHMVGSSTSIATSVVERFFAILHVEMSLYVGDCT